METNFRGILEKEIDSLIQPETLEGLVIVFKALFPISSMQDSLFGFVVGAIYSRFLSIMQLVYRRQANDAELKEFVELIERRTLEIKGKIRLAMGK
jgi:hypothetical protein